MRTIFRVILFSAISLYLTSIWNRGFVISSGTLHFFEATLAVSFIFYLLTPLSKLILFPLHLLTFGLISVVVSMGLLYVVDHYFSLIAVRPWIFPGAHIGVINLPKWSLDYLTNLLITSLSLSVIIKTLEKLT